MVLVAMIVSHVLYCLFDTTNISRHNLSHLFSTHTENSIFSHLHMYFEMLDDMRQEYHDNHERCFIIIPTSGIQILELYHKIPASRT